MFQYLHDEPDRGDETGLYVQQDALSQRCRYPNLGKGAMNIQGVDADKDNVGSGNLTTTHLHHVAIRHVAGPARLESPRTDIDETLHLSCVVIPAIVDVKPPAPPRSCTDLACHVDPGLGWHPVL